MVSREIMSAACTLGKLLMIPAATENDLAYKINCLPEWLRSYVHNLETRCDPAGELRDLWCCRQSHQALQRKIDELERELENAHGGENMGDIEYTSAILEEAKQEQKTLPAKEFRRLFDFTHAEMGCYVQKDSNVNYGQTPWCVIDVDGDVVARGSTPMTAMAEFERIRDSA